MNEAIGQVLPLAAAVGLSPIPVIAVVVILATPRARTNGPAFLLGWLIGLGLVGAGVLVVSGALDASDAEEPATWVSVLLLALGMLLIALAVKQWRGRPRGYEPAALPKWMSSIDDFRAPKALGFGALLSGANPKNLILTVAAAAEIAETGIESDQQTLALVVFILIGSIGVAVPVLVFFALGERSRELLDEVRSWMSAHNAAIMAVITLLIGFKLLGDGLSGL